MLCHKFQLLRLPANKNCIGALTTTMNQFKLNSKNRSIRVYSKLMEDHENGAPTIQKSFDITDQRLNNRISYSKSFEPKHQQKRRPQKNSNESYTDELMRLDPIEWSSDDLENIERNFYRPSEITNNRSADAIRAFQTKHNIKIKGSAPKPILTFAEVENLPGAVKDVIKKKNFIECTPIQAQGIPTALSGMNMVGIAQTG